MDTIPIVVIYSAVITIILLLIFFYPAFLAYKKLIKELNAAGEKIKNDLEKEKLLPPDQHKYTAIEIEAIQRLLISTQGKLLQGERMLVESSNRGMELYNEIEVLKQKAKEREERITQLKGKLRDAEDMILRFSGVKDNDESIIN